MATREWRVRSGRRSLAGVSLGAALLIAPGAAAQEAGARPTPLPATPPSLSVNADGSVALPVPELRTGDSVLERAHPEYDPNGLRVGDIILYPSLEGEAVYNSNVYNTASGAQLDVALALDPVLRFISNFPRHALQFFLGSRSLFYRRESSENVTDFTASADASLDVLRSTNIALNAAYQILHEPRGAPDLPLNAAKPTQYSLISAGAALNQVFNRLSLSAGTSLLRFVFDNTELLPPASPSSLDNHDRDRTVLGAYAQAGYEFSPGYSFYLRGSYNDRAYDRTTDRSGLRRASDGYEVDGGVRFALTRLIAGQIFGGYLRQFYRDPAFTDFAGFGYGAQFEWYPTELTTVRFDARHTIEETTLANASGYLNSHIGLELDHELLRNLILTAAGSYDRDSYRGIIQVDRYWAVTFGLAYLMNRNLSLDLGYTFSRRNSSISGLDYANHTLRIGLTGRF
jgi:hypothetical protein